MLWRLSVVFSMATFEDFKGLRTRGYLRDSTRDQREGFGPALQRHAIQRFASMYGLDLHDHWYEEYVSGRSVERRREFARMVGDAQAGAFDVLLCFHTSRFARNREDAAAYKRRLARSGVTIIFVSQGIISGTHEHFVAEGVFEVLDESRSREIGRFVGAGLRQKFEAGLANGVPPLGYQNEPGPAGRRVRKVPDPRTLPVLRALLGAYATGRYSYRSLARWLNSRGMRTRLGKPFTKAAVEEILANRFFAGQIVWHPGRPDEEVRTGIHDVPDDIRELWNRCQSVRSRNATRFVHQSGERRVYPLSGGLAICDACETDYYGQRHKERDGRFTRRLHHNRDARCTVRPRSQRADLFENQLAEGILKDFRLPRGWKARVLQALRGDFESDRERAELARLSRALHALRRQHLWGDVSDAEYKQERDQIRAHLRRVDIPVANVDLNRAGQLLSDFHGLWTHAGVTDRQRRDLARQVFRQVRIRGDRIVAVTPRREYMPLFAAALRVCGGRGERI